MDKKERNTKVMQIYVDQTGKNIDQTVKIIEKIPELVKAFNGKDLRRSCMGILQSLQVWETLKKPIKTPKEKEITKKELANILCKNLDINLPSIPSLLNMKKIDIANLIEGLTSIIEVEDFDDVQQYIEKQEAN